MKQDVLNKPLGNNDTLREPMAPPKRTWRVLRSILLSFFIIGAAIVGAAYINKTAPKARKRAPAKAVPLVRVIPVHTESHRVVVPAMGTVVPARQIILESRLSGEIVAHHPQFVPGGFLKKGAEVVRIDPQDYELALEQKKRAVADAIYALKLEKGHQDVAKREWELLDADKGADPGDMELALRKPHLAKARADLAAAEADLKQARLDLARTSIVAPFNCIVRVRDVDLGSQVSPQDRLATLVGTDEYWVQASVPVDRLEWIMIPSGSEKTGSNVRVFYRNGYECAGTVIKLLADLETEGRMARILVEVKDPLGLKTEKTKQPPLLIGEYVRLEIEGRQLQEVFRIPRSALRDNAEIWIATPDDKLEIRRVETVWRDTKTVLLQDGLKSGERLIVSDMPIPVNGMPVQVAE